MPKILVTERPYNAGTPLPALSSKLTDDESVYVRNHFEVPKLKVDDWSLSVKGSVSNPLSLSLAEIMVRPRLTSMITLECAGNGRASMEPLPKGTPWGYNAVSLVSFTGSPLKDLLEEAGVSASAREAVFFGADRGAVMEGREEQFVRSLPLDGAFDPNTILAWEMNGRPLTPDHGYPLRLVVPGWYGMASVKWLTEIQIWEHPFTGFFQSEHYVYLDEEGTPEGDPVRDIRVRSMIVQPEDGEEISAGTFEIRGIAWSGGVAVTKVELSFDQATSWHGAELEPANSEFGIQSWTYAWSPVAEPELQKILVRATDSAGERQPLNQRWNRLGYGNNGVHSVGVTVS